MKGAHERREDTAPKMKTIEFIEEGIQQKKRIKIRGLGGKG